MDPITLAAIATAILTPLSPYLVKAGESLASQIGKELATKTTNLIDILFKRSEENRSRQQISESLTKLDTDLDSRQTLQSFIIQQAQIDPVFAEHLNEQINDIRILLLESLQTKFLTQDLKELYFRLGLGWDSLSGTGSTNREKTIALIEEMWVSEKIPKLIRAMWQVRSDLRY